MITEKDFIQAVRDNLYVYDVVEKEAEAGKECFELAKKMAIEFLRHSIESGNIRVTDENEIIYCYGAIKSDADLFELYQQSKP